jgi:hypothetical protein
MSRFLRGPDVRATIIEPGVDPYKNAMAIYFEPALDGRSEPVFLFVGKEGNLAGCVLQIPAKAVLASQTGVPTDKVTI